MGLFLNSSLEFPPKIGESKEVTVKEITRIEVEGDKNNFKARGGKDYGFHYEATLDNGKKMKIGTWKLYFALKDSNIDFGQKMKISHPKEGEYIIEPLSEKKWEE